MNIIERLAIGSFRWVRSHVQTVSALGRLLRARAAGRVAVEDLEQWV